MPKAFDVLAILLQHHDRVVTKDELMSSLWPDASVTEDSISHCISILRKAFGDDTKHPTVIATISRRGYRFIAPLDEILADEPAVAGSKAPFAVPALATSPGGYLPQVDTENFASPADFRREDRKSGNWKPWLGGALLGSAAALAIGLVLLQVSRPPRNGREDISPVRFSVNAPSGTSLTSGAILSPNGRYLILLAEDERSGIGRIWIRSLDTLQSRPVPGTEGATQPFWSPDSRYIGFFAGAKLKRVGIDDQTPQVITSTGPSNSGAAWSSKGVVVFADVRSGLYSVPESGGTPTPLTTLSSKDQEIAHRWPQFLPDGEHFLYYDVSAQSGRAGTWLGSLHSKQADRILDVPAIFAQPGYLVFTRDHLLMAQAFDLTRPRAAQNPLFIRGTTFPGGSINASTLSAANLSVSANGLLTYASSGGMPRLTWFDRSGHEVNSVNMPTPVLYPVLSPDQKQVLVAGRDVDLNHEAVWLVDVARSVSTRIVSDGMSPLWSPDGTQIAFSADRGGNSFFIKHVTGSKEDTLVLRTPLNKVLNDWSPDGRYILYTSVRTDAKNDLWLLPMFGDQKPKPFLQTPFSEAQAQISPDGHWVAYASDESGAWEVYLDSFPESGVKRILSPQGGVEPHWRKDGKEIFYLSPDRNLMAVDVTLGPPLKIERPHALFRASVLPVSKIFRNQFAVSADGQRFLIGVVERTTNDEQITVVTSWPSLLSH
jgi:Tol biopolymer transport system component